MRFSISDALMGMGKVSGAGWCPRYGTQTRGVQRDRRRGRAFVPQINLTALLQVEQVFAVTTTLEFN
jgi:hypothetical protein